jgi:hypothetical protein
MAGGLVRLGRLWKVTSDKTGTTYLRGRIGDARILVMARKDNDGDSNSDHTHELLIGEATDAPMKGGR